MGKFLLIPLMCLTLVISGCKIPDNDDEEKVDKNKVAQDIARAMKSMSREDMEIAYKQFKGLADYMEHTEKVTTTEELNGVVTRFQEDYGYTREKYRTYSDKVERFLKDEGYGDATNIVTSKKRGSKDLLRSDVIDDMNTLAEAAKIALETKSKK